MPDLISISSDVLPDATHVVGAKGTEGLSQLYQLGVGLEIRDTSFNTDDAIRGRATLRFELGPDADPFAFHGIIAAIERGAGFAGLSIFQWLCAVVLITVGIVSAVRSGAPVRVAAMLGVLPVLVFQGIDEECILKRLGIPFAVTLYLFELAFRQRISIRKKAPDYCALAVVHMTGNNYVHCLFFFFCPHYTL